MLQKLKGWRTTLFNVATGLGMILPPVIDYLIASELFSKNVTFVLGLVNVVGNVYLRTLTTTPVGQAE